MVVDASAPDRAPRVVREMQRFGTIIVVGGGCYGGYYVRQLARAERAGALAWTQLLVVDRDARCPVAQLPEAERPSALRLVTAEWSVFFTEFLGGASADPAHHEADAIVPSPLMPHLMADWLGDRARARWPARRVATEPLGSAPAVPWQRAADDGTHYVSFAEWMCPINCIEPARCPHTRGARTWSLPTALAGYADGERAAGRPVEGPYVFHCAHRAFGVGMIDVRDVLAADRAIAALGAGPGRTAFLVGTASHCHGALRQVVVE
ncbi:MAG TPA: hypothetical protein VFI52_01880 [Gemmatimonadaceae bacterium]|nr:hypothetical protein [Gemmatimonadaceae bacterium]